MKLLKKMNPSQAKRNRQLAQMKNPGECSWNNHFARYTSSAAKRNLEFHLTWLEFIYICSLDCYYCGGKPEIRSSYSTPVKKKKVDIETYERSLIKANGIDRFDSKNGYLVSNCVPCCSICNWMKGTLNGDEFLNQSKLISERHKK